jgi:hypothetical protein
MRTLLIASFLVWGSTALAQTEIMKTKLTEVKKKGCPMVNGKEDCTATEVKTKVIEIKKKIGQ